MATKLEMASNALLLLGDEPITDFLGKGAGTVAMDQLYETTYVAMLTSANWGFSRTQLILVENVTPPLIDSFRFSYDLPADQIAILGLRSNQEYKLYTGDLLYTNDSAPELDYFLRTPEAQLPAYFVKLMEIELAARACIAVTDNASRAEALRSQARDEWFVAAGIDAHNDTNEAIVSSPFTEVRN